MKIGVGSTNPVKIEAVRKAVKKVFDARELTVFTEISGFKVPSGVAAQPFSEEETLRGARNRAAAILQDNPEYDFAFGLEGGVHIEGNQLFSTVWVVVQHRSGTEQIVNGARFPLPEDVSLPIREGMEMGEVMSQRMQRSKINEQEGMIGVLTGGVLDRETEYRRLAELAFALWIEANSDQINYEKDRTFMESAPRQE